MKADILKCEYLLHSDGLISAIATNTDYEGAIETAELMHPHHIFEEESQSWYTVYLAHDVIREDGEVHVVLKRCWDGEWDILSYYSDDEELEDLYEDSRVSYLERTEWETRATKCECCGDEHPADELDDEHCSLCIESQLEMSVYEEIGREI